MCTTSPTLITSWYVSVAMMPSPAVTNNTWSLLWVCILFRAPGAKLTTPRLKLLLISGVSSGCRVTAPPVNKGLLADSAGISLGLSTFAIGAFSLQPLGLLLLPGDMVDSVTFGVSRRLLYQILDRFCNHTPSPIPHVFPTTGR